MSPLDVSSQESIEFRNDDRGESQAFFEAARTVFARLMYQRETGPGDRKGKVSPPAEIIQVSTEDQMGTVESLAKEIWTEHYVPIIGLAQVDYMLSRFQTKEAISDQIREGVLYFLMEEGDVPVGYIAVQPEEGELFLSKIYVRSGDRRRGYGKRAMRFVECLAREKGLTKISLTVNRNNRSSISTYEKMGFRNLGPVVKDIGGGFVMDDYRMEKIVSPTDHDEDMGTDKTD